MPWIHTLDGMSFYENGTLRGSISDAEAIDAFLDLLAAEDTAHRIAVAYQREEARLGAYVETEVD